MIRYQTEINCLLECREEYSGILDWGRKLIFMYQFFTAVEVRNPCRYVDNKLQFDYCLY